MKNPILSPLEKKRNQITPEYFLKGFEQQFQNHFKNEIIKKAKEFKEKFQKVQKKIDDEKQKKEEKKNKNLFLIGAAVLVAPMLINLIKESNQKIIDITKEKKQELQTEAQKMYEVVSPFATGVSQEVENTMKNVKGYIGGFGTQMTDGFEAVLGTQPNKLKHAKFQVEGGVWGWFLKTVVNSSLAFMLSEFGLDILNDLFGLQNPDVVLISLGGWYSYEENPGEFHSLGIYDRYKENRIVEKLRIAAGGIETILENIKEEQLGGVVSWLSIGDTYTVSGIDAWKSEIEGYKQTFENTAEAENYLRARLTKRIKSPEVIKHIEGLFRDEQRVKTQGSNRVLIYGNKVHLPYSNATVPNVTGTKDPSTGNTTPLSFYTDTLRDIDTFIENVRVYTTIDGSIENIFYKNWTSFLNSISGRDDYNYEQTFKILELLQQMSVIKVYHQQKAASNIHALYRGFQDNDAYDIVLDTISKNHLIEMMNVENAFFNGNNFNYTTWKNRTREKIRSIMNEFENGEKVSFGKLISGDNSPLSKMFRTRYNHFYKKIKLSRIDLSLEKIDNLLKKTLITLRTGRRVITFNRNDMLRDAVQRANVNTNYQGNVDKLTGEVKNAKLLTVDENPEKILVGSLSIQNYTDGHVQPYVGKVRTLQKGDRQAALGASIGDGKLDWYFMSKGGSVSLEMSGAKIIRHSKSEIPKESESINGVAGDWGNYWPSDDGRNNGDYYLWTTGYNWTFEGAGYYGKESLMNQGWRCTDGYFHNTGSKRQRGENLAKSRFETFYQVNNVSSNNEYFPNRLSVGSHNGDNLGNNGFNTWSYITTAWYFSDLGRNEWHSQEHHIQQHTYLELPVRVKKFKNVYLGADGFVYRILLYNTYDENGNLLYSKKMSQERIPYDTFENVKNNGTLEEMLNRDEMETDRFIINLLRMGKLRRERIFNLFQERLEIITSIVGTCNENLTVSNEVEQTVNGKKIKKAVGVIENK